MKILDRNCPDLGEYEKSFLCSNWQRLKKELYCPFCDNLHKPYNGTGPGEFEILSLNVGGFLRWLLKFIPWDVWIQRTAVPFHDWMSVWGSISGVTFKQCNQVFKELVELDIEYYYKKKTEGMWWPRRQYWKAFHFLLLKRVDEICKYFVGSAQTKEDYETTSCRIT